MDSTIPAIKAPILEHYQKKLGNQTIYWAVDQPDQPQIGDWRLESLTYLDQTRLYETVGVTYEITLSIYYARNQNSQPQWHSLKELVVLSFSGTDGTWPLHIT